jgi:phosphopantothenoylcysteine decarboxylase/phosphopantothenate--cysteine ligase
MGKALAEAALAAGHEVAIVSGPVEVAYPAGAEITPVVTTDEMLEASRRIFATCDGAICAAAPCDYRPEKIAVQKIAKTGEPLTLHLIETPDVCATLGLEKSPEQWLVGFALETEDQRFRALVKLERKHCDLMVLNGPQAMTSEDNAVEIMDRSGGIIASVSGDKGDVAREILRLVQERLIARSLRTPPSRQPPNT